jgi:hypothetical protein
MSKINHIQHIYVICNKDKEPDKYAKWLGWINHNNIPEDYISFYCYKWGDELSEEDLKEYSLDDGTLVKLFPFRAPFPLKKSEISLSINFLNVFKMALEKKQEYILVFESDAILHPNFINLMNSHMKELFESYSNWHMFSIGCGMNKHFPKVKKNKHIYLGKEIRCLDSFVINERGMRFLVENLKKVKIPIDEHLDIFVKSNKLFILWLEPTIVVQGSQTGINPTTIRYSNAIFVDNCEWLKDVKFK